MRAIYSRSTDFKPICNDHIYGNNGSLDPALIDTSVENVISNWEFLRSREKFKIIEEVGDLGRKKIVLGEVASFWCEKNHLVGQDGWKSGQNLEHLLTGVYYGHVAEIDLFQQQRRDGRSLLLLYIGETEIASLQEIGPEN